MRSSVQYTALRLLIFLGCMTVLWFIPWMRERAVVLLFTAATVSMLISVFALNGLRNRMSAEIAEKVQARHLRHGEHGSVDDREHEDLEDEGGNVAPPAGERYR
ncbi:MAG: DUF4229 domain-containing protein [Austwickia sp.]|jgi:hypothetical protein|nr:DUF4229 domain-containing protein [Austwickia sp.]MBK8436657.1 DUF4229 domain-containing protein [Austwickia sp.]MBK9100289.1 DUF4229 domain-containing protein [Austwickia sp.]